MESYKEKMKRKVLEASLRYDAKQPKYTGLVTNIIVGIFVTVFLSVAIHQIFFK